MPLEATLLDARHFTLARHHLNVKMSPDRSVEVVAHLCGLQAQQLLPAELALWNRVAGYARGWLETALYQERMLVRGWCMRGTLHIMPAADWSLYREATKESWLSWWRRTLAQRGRLSIEERQRLIHPYVMDALAAGPLTRKELRRRLLPRVAVKEEELGLYALAKELCYLGYTVPGPQEGMETTFVPLDQWLPQYSVMSVGVEEARKRLFLQYLASYGPATLQDFAHFTGLPVSPLRVVLAATRAQIEEVHVPGVKGALWLRREDIPFLTRAGRRPLAPVRLLPKFDPLILGHKDKTRILATPYRKHVLRPAADIAATVLVNGEVQGIWRYAKKRAHLVVSVTPFTELDSPARSALEDEVAELAKFFGLASADLRVAPLRS